MKITGSIITLNEEEHIKECILSLQKVCDEIIVVDSNSSDHTVEIAKELGAKVVMQSYLGDGFQKNVVLEYASYDWILSLDADERLSEEMVAEIQTIDLENTKYECFGFSRKNYVGNRWIKYCGWYPDVCTRLFNGKKTKWWEVKLHSYVLTKNTQVLKGDIIHYSFRNLSELFAKPDRNYSAYGAKILFDKHKKVSAFSPAMHLIMAFIRRYILRLGFLNGVDGLTVSISSALNSYLKYAKLLEMYRDPKAADREKKM